MRATSRTRPLGPRWFLARPAPHAARAPSHVGRLSQAACVLVPIVGACCSGCAEGKGCAAKAELELLHAQEREKVGTTPRVGDKALPWSDVEAVDSVVRQFDADVRTKGNAGMQFLWLTEIIGFWPRWRAWFDATKDSWAKGIIGGITGHNLETFESYRHEFNVLVDQMKQAGLVTNVNQVDTTDKSPLQEGIEKGAESAGEGLGAFGAALGASVGTLIWVGGALVAAYFLGPPLITALVARRRAA